MKAVTTSISVLALALGLVTPSAGGQMATDPGPRFDVASVREARNDGQVIIDAVQRPTLD